MDAELEAVKTALSNLKGCTIQTEPRGKPNYIVDITEKGFKVRANNTKPIPWAWVLDGYSNLRKESELDNRARGTMRPFSYRGAFIMPLLAQLTTVEWVEGKVPRTLRYVKEGRPPLLRQDVQSRDKRRLTVLLERDEDGYYVASVPELRGCHTQGETLDEVLENIRDAASLCLGVEQEDEEVKLVFIGVHTIEV